LSPFHPGKAFSIRCDYLNPHHYCPDVHDAEVGLALCFQWWERGPRV
jgi:hypothetical protein